MAPYFTVLAPAVRGDEVAQWDEIKAAVSEALIEAGGTITHHHAVGRDHRAWYDRQRPAPFAAALRAAKAELDPSGMLNPGVLIDPADRDVPGPSRPALHRPYTELTAPVRAGPSIEPIVGSPTRRFPMLKSARRRIQTIVVLGVSAALVVVGVAAAQSIGGNSKSGKQSNGKAKQGRKMHGRPGGGPLGVPMKALTYGEFHVQKNGEAAVVRVDQGKIKSVGSDSITLVENDESEVTIAIDADTKVVGKPGSETSVSDLKAGQEVVVSGPKGGTAKTVALPAPPGQGEGPHPAASAEGRGAGA